MKVRVHHLFCAALFQGKGYSRDFVENMRVVAEELFSGKRAAEEIELCVTPDLICRRCPNLKEKVCILDHNEAKSKDIRLADALGLACGIAYRKEALLRKVAGAISKEMFEDSCGRCMWYAAGLCSYERLRDAYQAYDAGSKK